MSAARRVTHALVAGFALAAAIAPATAQPAALSNARIESAPDLAPLDALVADARRWLLWVILILGGMLGIGWVLLSR